MNNIEKIRQAMSGREYGAILITSPINRLFATGFSSSAGALLITANDAIFLTDTRYIEAAEMAISGARVSLSTNDNTYSAQIKTVLDANGIESVGFEDSVVTYSGYHEWTEKLGRKLVPVNRLITGLRAVKSSADLEKMKKAQRIAEKSYEEVLPLISTDMTEKQLAAELIYRFLKNGADETSFDPIVVSGPRSSMPHGVPGPEKIKEGFITLDFGVKLDGWCSDTTRTLCIGSPSDEMVRAYDTVLEAQHAGIKAARAGVGAESVDKAARAVIENAGYGEYFGHGFGHELGLEVHETLKASPISEDVLPAGAVISAEPGVYIPGRFGVRIEDVLFITEGGSENITKLPKHLVILPGR